MNKIKIRPLWVWATAGVGVALFLYQFQGILLPFFAGLLVAYALSPAVKYLTKRGLSRTVATLLLMIAFFVSILLLLFIAIPFLQAELVYLASRVPQYGSQLMTLVQPWVDHVDAYVQPEDITRLKALASTHLGDLIAWAIRLFIQVFAKSLALANLFSLIVITPVVAFYCLRDWEKLITTLDKWLPRAYAPTLRRLFAEINATIGGFAKGQSLVCLILGCYYSIALTLAGLDFSGVVGSIIGITAFIPYVGALLGFLLSLGIALAQFSDWTPIGIIIGIFFVGQMLEGYFLVPHFVGDRIRLHPVWVIFSLLAGGALYGFLGILFALPIAATLGVFLRHGLQLYMKSPYYLAKS